MAEGVRRPIHQTRSGNKGTPNTVAQVGDVQQVAVRYYDGRGQEVREIWYLMFGKYYQPPGSEAFSQGLRLVQDKFAAQVEKLHTPARKAQVAKDVAAAAADEVLPVG